MKKTLGNIILAFLVPLCILAQDDTINQTQKGEDLIGDWTVDLRPSPDSEGYYQPFNVESVAGNTFIGSFYGSQIENAFFNKNWDRLYFAFTTKDQSNTYYHSGYLSNGEVSGISYCPTREFTAPWTGLKK